MKKYLKSLVAKSGDLNRLDLRYIMDDLSAIPFVDSIHYNDLGAKHIAKKLAAMLARKVKLKGSGS